ncbi:MAG: hypothetical protein KC502_02830 [Myxococcales bacterium]|nr:hypothetical protein [Myxococcales bacterium]
MNAPLHHARQVPMPTSSMSGVAVLCALCMAVSTLVACGGAPQRKVSFAQPKAEPGHKRLARALRLAAKGRVQARAGLDGQASESLRLSYKIEPQLAVLTAHAQAAERAHYFGQAHAAWREMLNHRLDESARKNAIAEAERLAPLVPSDHVAVLVTVSPPHAHVNLSHRGKRRVVMSDGVVWLQAGSWQASTVANGYKSELRAFQIRRRGSQSVAFVLERGRDAPKIAGSGANARRQPDARKTPAKPRVDPDSPKETAKATEPDPPEDPEPADPDPAKTEAPVTKAPVVAKRGRQGSSLHKWGSIATASLGVVAIGVGGYFGFNAMQNADVANGLSKTRSDYKTQLDFYSAQAKDGAQMANTLFIAGGALAAAGTVWWFLAPKQPTSSALLPKTMSLQGRGLALLWTF